MLIVLIAIIVGSIGLDQLTKWLAVTYLEGEESFPLWEDVLHFTFVKNEGAAFGIFSEHRWIFMVISTVAIIGIGVYLFGFCRKSNRLMQISLAMIIGGGIGNMIDRIALGYVIDFIDFRAFPKLWMWIFNVADSFVTVGAFMLMGYLVWDMIREYKNEKTAKIENAAQSEWKEGTDGRKE